MDEEGHYSVDHAIEGDDVNQVLAYVQYDRRELVERVRRTTETALKAGDISLEESALLRKRYEQGLQGYTYLARDD